MAKAKTDEKVMALVEQELKKDPAASVDELYDKAVAAEKSVSKLTKRQFNARYPLQVKRRQKMTTKAGERRGGGSKKRKKRKKKDRAAADSAATAGREAVRRALMKFASDMASAEARKDLVQFLAGIDRYVDDIIKAASR